MARQGPSRRLPAPTGAPRSSAEPAAEHVLARTSLTSRIARIGLSPKAATSLPSWASDSARRHQPRQHRRRGTTARRVNNHDQPPASSAGHRGGRHSSVTTPATGPIVGWARRPAAAIWHVLLRRDDHRTVRMMLRASHRGRTRRHCACGMRSASPTRATWFSRGCPAVRESPVIGQDSGGHVPARQKGVEQEKSGATLWERPTGCAAVWTPPGTAYSWAVFLKYVSTSSPAATRGAATARQPPR